MIRDRPLIDERGQILGVANIIDVGVLQLATAGVAAGVTFAMPDAGALPIAVIVAADLALLAALARDDPIEPDDEPSDDEPTTDPDAGADSDVAVDVVDDATIASLELPNGETYDVILRSRDAARADGGEVIGE